MKSLLMGKPPAATEMGGRMKKINSLDEVKKIGLEGLVTFHHFCMEHHLKYSLGAGTMIGAVRHKGFIPWDDDIDIFMMRDEYDRFLALISGGEKMDNGDYVVKGPSEDTIQPFIKIIHKGTVAYEINKKKEYAVGVWIDIFPIDNCGDTEEECRKIEKYMKKNSKRLMWSIMHYPSGDLMSRIKNAYLFLFQKVAGADYRKYKKNIVEYDFPDSGKYAGTIVWPFQKGKDLCDIYPAEYFKEYMLTEFEGKEFMIFVRYDEILRHRYGEYMILPKEEDRISHELEVYYRD